jgi:hypothetical protein
VVIEPLDRAIQYAAAYRSTFLSLEYWIAPLSRVMTVVVKATAATAWGR